LKIYFDFIDSSNICVVVCERCILAADDDGGGGGGGGCD